METEMSLAFIRSEWPSLAMHQWERTFSYHVESYARWLNSAGAEPRFSVVLCVGKNAREAFSEAMSIHGVTAVTATATDRRPMPEDVARHEGTHFNSKLFLVDGFDGCNARDVFRTLNGQRSLMRRSATWVALVIESVEALMALYDAAPDLTAAVMRRCLVITGPAEGGPQGAAPATQYNLWMTRGLIAEQVFHTYCTDGVVADYPDMSRLFRTGYGKTLDPKEQPDWQPWFDLWNGRRPPLQPDLSLPLASAVGRHGGDFTDQEAAVLATRLAERPFCRIAASLAAQDDADSAYHLALAGEAQATLGTQWPDSIRARTESWSEHTGGIAVVEMAIAQGYGAADDVDGCLGSLHRAVAAADQPSTPELYFEAVAARMKLEVLLSMRTDARHSLDILESVAPRLQGPYFDARALLARGDYRAPLDPSPARDDYREAERQFRAHGYAEWSRAVSGRWQD